MRMFIFSLLPHSHSIYLSLYSYLGLYIYMSACVWAFVPSAVDSTDAATSALLLAGSNTNNKI